MQSENTVVVAAAMVDLIASRVQTTTPDMGLAPETW